MAYGIIYQIENIINGKKYIGQTIRSLEKRWLEHIRRSKKSKYPLHRAIKKYSQENFAITTLFECSTQKELDEKELLFAEQLHTLAPYGYNLAAGRGTGSVSKQTRKKLSLIRTGMTHSDESKKKMSDTRKGENNGMFNRTHSIGARKKISEANSGRKHERTPEIIAKFSASISKTYYFINLQGNKVVIKNLKAFCRDSEIKFLPQPLGEVISGKRKSYKGWKRDEEFYSSLIH